MLFVPFSSEEGDLDYPVNEQDAQTWEAMSSKTNVVNINCDEKLIN